MSSTLVSAPGKVLIAGGYLVLDPAYPGLVIATDSRFYTLIRPLAASPAADEASSFTLRVRSPQFTGALWEYVASVSGAEAWSLVQTRKTHASPTAGSNPFVSLSLLYAVKLASEVRGAAHVAQVLRSGSGLEINVLAANDFYSQRQGSKAPTTQELRALPPFNVQPCAIRDVHKTGLGSSAAMTTSLVASLLLHLGAIEASLTQQDLALAHNVAQLAHCAAQGKVGSGFDVSSAIWGSHLFRRFDPAALASLLQRGDKVSVQDTEEPSSQSAEPLLPHLKPSNPLWHPAPLTSSSAVVGGTHPTAVEGLHVNDSQTPDVARPAPLELPPRIEMVLADVDTGSNTPSLVGKVMEWRKKKPEWAAQLYSVLAASNANLADALLALRLAHARDAAQYDAVIDIAASVKSKAWDEMQRGTSTQRATHPSEVLGLLIDVRNALRAVIAGMRELGQRAGAPVEPDEMCRVIRASIDAAPGVLGGGVPGAGGFDALYLLHLRPTTSSASEPAPARSAVEELWSTWSELSVGPLLSAAGASAASSPVAPSSQDAEHPDLPQLTQSAELGGLRVESLEAVRGLKDAVEREQAQ